MLYDETQDTCGAACGMEAHERRLSRINQRLPGWLESFGVPARYITDYPLPTPVRKAITTGQSILLHGPTGTGKTTTLVAALREIMRNSVLADGCSPKQETYRFVNYNEFLFAAQDVFRSEHDRILDYLKPIANCEVLLLDDMGKKRTTGFVLDALYYIIEQRDAHNRQTLITTNLGVRAFEKEFDASIASRLLGMCTPVQFSGHDFRIAKKEKPLS